MTTNSVEQIRVLDSSGQSDAALALLKLLLSRNSENLEAWSLKADIEERLGRVEEAAASYQQVAILTPSDTGAWLTLGDFHARHFNVEQAVQAYDTALTIKPDSLKVLRKRLDVSAVEIPDTKVSQLLRQALDSKRSEDSRAKALFLLGQIYIEGGFDEHGFEFYRAANALVAGQQSGSMEYRIPKSCVEFLSNESRWSGAKVDRPSGPLAVITGLPRSGKSLVERLLGQHAQVHSGGELALVRKLAGAARGALQKEQIQGSSSLEDSTDLAAQCSAVLRASGRESARLVADTSPANLPVLHFLAQDYPQVPIIFCRRDPLDLGLSIFFKKFRSGHRYSYDLETLGRALARSECLMDLWLRSLPNPMCVVSYERLTTKPGEVQNALYDFLGLPNTVDTRDVFRAPVKARLFPSRSPEQELAISDALLAFGTRFAGQLTPMLAAREQEKNALIRSLPASAQAPR